MGVQPPSGDDLHDPEPIEFGIAALDGELREADFSYPVEHETVREAFGETAVPYDPAGHTVELDTVLERVDSEQFDSEQDLLDELHPVFEELRDSRTGLLTRLRALVPL